MSGVVSAGEGRRVNWEVKVVHVQLVLYYATSVFLSRCVGGWQGLRRQT